MNTRLINEAKSVLESDNIGTIASLTERLEANNAELDKLNELIEKHITDEEFATEFEAVVRYQDAARGTLGELKARQALLRLSQPSITAPLAIVRHSATGSYAPCSAT
ncbi:hypothetical protein MTO96_037956 [Rhipicephalus appendiculatus]